MIEQVKQLAKKYGAKLSKRSHDGSYSYNGRTIALFEDKEKQQLRAFTHIIHDIAHYAIASIAHRKLREFGLGSSPDDGSVNILVAKDMTYTQACNEEELASALGIFFERQLGLKWRDTFLDHCWDLKEDTGLDGKESESLIFNPKADHKFAIVLRKLEKRKLLL